MAKTSNKKMIIFFILTFLLFLYKYCTVYSLYTDNIWNFGASYNIATGLLPYKDFNLLTFPLSNFITIPFIILFKYKIISYYIMLSIVLTLCIYITYKINKKALPIIIALLMLENFGSYNCLSLLFVLLLILLERKNKNDYLIGFILGLTVMSKQVMLLMIIPTFFTKDISKIFKRFIGACIPWIALLLYLLINNIFFDFINYTLLGMFDFGKSNSKFTIFIIFWIVAVIVVLKGWKKHKDITYLYSLFYLIIAVPIFDLNHIALTLIPFLIVTTENYKFRGKVLNTRNIDIIAIVSITIFLSCSFIYLSDKINYFNLNSKSSYFLTISNNNLDNWADTINKYYMKYKKDYSVYFLDDIIYYYKLNYNIPINKFDMTLCGNNGYNGTPKLEKQIQNINKDTVFIVAMNQQKSVQHNNELFEFIDNNYKVIDEFPNYRIYLIEN